MIEQNVTIRFEIDPPLSDEEILELSENLLHSHDAGIRHSAVITEDYEYAYSHRGSRMIPLEGGMIHRYEGSLYDLQGDPATYEFGFKLIEKTNPLLS